MCLESGLVELIDNNCQQSSAAPFTAESPCLSLSSLSLYRFRQLQGSRLPSSSQAPPSFPVPCQAKRPATATPPKDKRSPLCCTVSHSTQAPRSSRWPLRAPWLLCFASLVHSLSPHQLALGYSAAPRSDSLLLRTADPRSSTLPCLVVALHLHLLYCLSVLSEWTRLRAIHCPTPSLAAPGLGDPSLAIFPANLTSFTFAPETWPRYGYRLHSSTSPFPSTFAFLILIRICGPTSSNSRKIRIKSHC